jgi:hypothetical protein
MVSRVDGKVLECAMSTPADRAAGESPVIVVLVALFAVGWQGIHFTALIPVLGLEPGFSVVTTDTAFALYAVGLPPGLVSGGYLSVSEWDSPSPPELPGWPILSARGVRGWRVSPISGRRARI